MNHSTLEFLANLRNLKVRLFSDGEQLKYSAPAGAITASLRQELVSRKYEIVKFLQEANLAALSEPIKPISRDSDLPLSSMQGRLWLLYQLGPEHFAYNIPSYFRLKGDLNIDVLGRCLNEIVRRHEVLRTCYLNNNGRPSVQIASASPVALDVTDLEGLPVDVQDTESEQIARRDALRAFRLEETPLLRASLLKYDSRSHLLLVTFCHLAFDGWSLGVFARELSALYPEFLHGRPSPLTELPLQYVDYAARQQQLLRGDLLKPQLEYWLESLRGCPTVLDLPADRSRPLFQTSNGGGYFFELTPSLTAELKRLSREHGVTLFVATLAIFSTLLMRYSGQEEFLIGVPVSNRNQTELEDLIGAFVNTLVMRADLSGNPSFLTLLERLHNVAVGAYSHLDVPFEKLVEAINPPRDVGRSPLFQVLFSLEHSPVAPIELPGLEPSWPEIQSTSAQFDLSLFLTETNNNIFGRFSYNSDLFDQATVVRMARHFEELVTGVLDDAGHKVNEFPLVAGAEREQLVHLGKGPVVDCPLGSGIHELFERQASRKPDAVAVECDGQRLTYRELDERANRLAAFLQSLGAGPESIVAVCLERSIEMAVALTAVLKAGAAYLPLDVTFPRQRLEFMLRDASPCAVITRSDLLDHLPEHDAERICVDRFPSPADPQPSRLPAAFDRAYVLYTSGSTGQPKGVEVTHRSVVNFLNAMRHQPGLGENDILLSVTTYSFDIFGLEFWLPLTTGAKVVIASAAVCKDGLLLQRAIAESGATIMQGTPTTWRVLLESEWPGSPGLKILCGGEAWPQDLASRLLPKCESLWNMYGPTETTIWSSVYQVRAGSPIWLGAPIANTQFYIVNRQLQLQPPGVAGELLIGGEGLARGYLHSSNLTNDAFIPNPFNRDPQRRVYRTGDLVRWRDGNLEYIARLDHQVKLRGFRIELGEVESALRSDLSVKDAIALLTRDPEPELVAFCVLAKESVVTEVQLRESLRSRLPDYMVPRVIVFLPSLPLTPNGKVDREALMAALRKPREVPSAVVQPRDHFERQLVRIWERVLKVRPIAPTDNFFDLGGHSFAAVLLLSEIRQLTGKNLPLATFFRAATVEALAEILRSSEPPSWSVLAPMAPRGSKPPLFLVHGAEGNILLYRRLVQHLGPDQPLYGLQSQGLSGDQPFLETIEEMARTYVREVVAVQPEGPYLLGGYCMGGVVALEMAQQLKAAGKEVGLVLLLESYNAAYSAPPAKFPRAPVYALQNLWFHAMNLAILPSSERKAFLREKLAVTSARTRLRFRRLSYRFESGGSRELQRAYPHLFLTPVNDLAASRYRPVPYDGRVVLIRPRRFFAGLEARAFGWRDVVRGKLEILDGPAYPRGMLVGPFCRSLAKIIGRCLDEVAESERER